MSDIVTELRLTFLDEPGHPYNAEMALWIRGLGPKPDSPLYVRDGEILLFVRRGLEAGYVCAECGKPLMDGMFCWDHRITTGPGYDGRPFQLGENRFPGLRHADGTTCGTDSAYCCYAMPRCGKCGSYDSFKTAQQAYGDLVTCRVCGDENYYSIGD